MAIGWINAENMQAELLKRMNEEMMLAAEPVIKKAVEEAEKAMRLRLSTMFVSVIEGRYDLYRDGQDLCIKVYNVPKGAK